MKLKEVLEKVIQEGISLESEICIEVENNDGTIDEVDIEDVVALSKETSIFKCRG